MPLEMGGRADKLGNRYEINWTIYQLLKIIDENIYSVTLEALGDDEKGTDLLIVHNNNTKEHQQCKARNSSKEYWTYGDLNRMNIFNGWKSQLDRAQDRIVSLVSPISFTFLVDLNSRANNTSDNQSQFYKEQILKSSKEFRSFYMNYCNAMRLDTGKTSDISRSINYLKRTNYKQFSDYEILELVEQKIAYTFSTSRDIVYSTFVSMIINKDILGKEITLEKLYTFFEKEKIQFRNIGLDKRIKPRFVELNEEYEDVFHSLSSGFVKRDETEACLQELQNGNSIILHGKAGYGKSGCTQEIIKFYKYNALPYISIKLDKRIPSISSESWGKELGLPASIPHCLHEISKNEQALIILDQLDALRWTQSNSFEAIIVCMEIIRQVKYLNSTRKNKISIIFVCRTYDLENDNNIRNLFSVEEKGDETWRKVVVDNFDNQTVESIVGDIYTTMNAKLQSLLSIPSNLYIWQQLDNRDNYNSIFTTSNLIKKWFEQIKMKSINFGVSESKITNVITDIVNKMDKIGRLFLPLKIIKIEESTLSYLKSCGMLDVTDNKISFVHQSVIDYFIAEKMLNDYYSDKDILSIIGDKSKQTPARRYQIQMLMQDIFAYSSEDFLRFGEEILKLKEVRYYVKYIFYELLSQIDNPDVHIQKFILSNIDNEKLIDIVVYSRKRYISILRDNNILDKWYCIDDKKPFVINLIKSISPKLDDEDVTFIRKYALDNEEEAMQFLSCFGYDINQDSDNLFQLRMEIYRKYPKTAKDSFIDLKKMLKKCERRTIDLLSFWLSEKIKTKENNLFGYEEDLLSPDDDIFIYYGNEVLDELLCHVPNENVTFYTSEWSSYYYINKRRMNLERICIEIIKKANIAIIKKSPKLFWSRYLPILDDGNIGNLYIEILLDAFCHFSSDDSDRIMQCLIKCPKESLIERTSGNNNDLESLKNVLKKHSKYCNQDLLNEFINQVILYKSKNMLDYYKHRIEQNKTKEYSPVFWTFWGDFQYEVLQSISRERLTNDAISLLEVLKRRFRNINSRYNHIGEAHSGSVSSPVSGKTISIKQWLQIITNTKLNARNRSKWIEVKGGVIESSIEMFANSFRTQVMKEPKKMINIVLENKSIVLEEYINAMFSGVEQSELLNSLDKELLIDMFISFPCDMLSLRARDFCQIIEKRSDIVWPKVIIDLIINITLYHTDPYIKDLSVSSNKEKENNICNDIQIGALNCVRGSAAKAIGAILWERQQFYLNFKELIEMMSKDTNVVIRYASLWMLWPAYNIDREWASNLILSIYKSDINLCSFFGTREMFNKLYTGNKEDIRSLILNCAHSDEEELKRIGVYSLIETYFIYDDFQKIVNNVSAFDEKQAKYALEMIVVYFNVERYCNSAKKLILRFANLGNNTSFALTRLFYDKYIKIDRDKEFLLELVNTNAGKYFISSFISYLEKQYNSIIDFADIIIVLCKKILNSDDNELKNIRIMEDEISKLIISLYDETINIQKDVALQCMDCWDIMFEKQIGTIRKFSQELMDR